MKDTDPTIALAAQSLIETYSLLPPIDPMGMACEKVARAYLDLVSRPVPEAVRSVDADLFVRELVTRARVAERLKKSVKDIESQVVAPAVARLSTYLAERASDADAARTAVPELLDEIERLKAELAKCGNVRITPSVSGISEISGWSND